jgi:hypothetical protein
MTTSLAQSKERLIPLFTNIRALLSFSASMLVVGNFVVANVAYANGHAGGHSRTHKGVHSTHKDAGREAGKSVAHGTKNWVTGPAGTKRYWNGTTWVYDRKGEATIPPKTFVQK